MVCFFTFHTDFGPAEAKSRSGQSCLSQGALCGPGLPLPHPLTPFPVKQHAAWSFLLFLTPFLRSPAVSLAPPSPPVSLTSRTAACVTSQGEQSEAPAVYQCACTKSCSRHCFTRSGDTDLCRDSYKRKSGLASSCLGFAYFTHLDGLQLDPSCFPYTQNVSLPFFFRGTVESQAAQKPKTHHVSTSLLRKHFVVKSSCLASLCSCSFPEKTVTGLQALHHTEEVGGQWQSAVRSSTTRPELSGRRLLAETQEAVQRNCTAR